MSITALIMINAEPGAIAELGTQLADIDGITEAHSVAGGDVDLVAIAKVETHDEGRHRGSLEALRDPQHQHPHSV